ncbi:MAG: hypothetical protein ACYTHM_08200, partial [Planctomycetota bacterium]
MRYPYRTALILTLVLLANSFSRTPKLLAGEDPAFTEPRPLPKPDKGSGRSDLQFLCTPEGTVHTVFKSSLYAWVSRKERVWWTDIFHTFFDGTS